MGRAAKEIAGHAVQRHRGSHELYRLFAEDGRLLYIGISHSARFRLMQHVRKPWWPDVARKEMERHPNRATALRAERVAIQKERPIWNVQARPALTSEECEYRLSRLAAAVERESNALDQSIAGARRDGHSFREIGNWAGVNHECARTVSARINGPLPPQQEGARTVSERRQRKSKTPNAIGATGAAVAENLSRLRKVRQMSQHDLAQALAEIGHPLHATAITRIELMSRRVDVDDLAALASALGVPPASLLEAAQCETCSGHPPRGFTCTECSATTPKASS
ncbi:helix-turn-helix domain-containing protein [Streptomyces sp. NPDC051578]|uniref:helix-turn-helix domain-containing protein n=1 Tax=Streptomyces sp. NPDC051578 TaxID=3365662 RepID=UPI0037949502